MGGDQDWLFRRTPGPTGKNDAGDTDKPVKSPKTPGSAGGSADKDAKVRESLKKVDRLIAEGKRNNLVYAPANLQHWRDGSGKKVTMPAKAFSGEKFVIEWLKKEVRQKFLDGTEKRLRAGTLQKGGDAVMTWESAKDLYPPPATDLFFALGGFTIRSEASVHWDFAEGEFSIFQFKSWTCRVKDVYNWDSGKSTFIPGFGTITDDELKDLENAGYGKQYDIDSEAWNVTDSSLLQEFAIAGF